MTTPVTIARGLIQKADFSSLAGGTLGTNWSLLAEPSLCCFGPSPIARLRPTIGGLDAGGNRESTPLYEPPILAVFYGAGDGTQGPGGAWRPQLATSTDFGQTWAKHGYVLPLNGLANGTGGTYAGRDMGWVEKRGSTYYLHPIIGLSGTIAPPNGKGLIPIGPYVTDLWSAPARDGPWTFVGPGLPLGSFNSFDGGDCYTCSVIEQGGTYYLFYGAAQGGTNVLNFGIATGSTPTSFTKSAGPIIPATSDVPENADIFFHQSSKNSLGVWCLFDNESDAAGQALGVANRNGLRLSSSLTDWSSLAGYKWPQHTCLLDSLGGSIGYPRAIRTPEAGVLIDENGYVPATYDGDSDGPTGDYHTGRHIKLTVFEPSAQALEYSPGGGDAGHLTSLAAAAHASFIAEYEADYSGTPQAGSGFGIDFLTQVSGDSYRAWITPGGGFSLQKSSGGTYSTLASSSGSQVTEPGLHHRNRVQATVTGPAVAIILTLDGELQVSFTDSSSAFTTGTGFRFSARGVNGQVRLFHARTSDTLTVVGLRAGQAIRLLAGGYVPVASGTASGPTWASSGLTHYPITHVEVDGTPLAIPGLGWGGDTISISTSTGSGSGRRRRALLGEF